MHKIRKHNKKTAYIVNEWLKPTNSQGWNDLDSYYVYIKFNISAYR